MALAAVSTVPGAVSTLLGYMNTVATSTTVSNVTVYEAYSEPIAGMAYNYMAVGDYAGGIIVGPETFAWRQLPGTSGRRMDSYALFGHVRVWAGGYDVVSRLADAYTLMGALHNQIRSDVGGSGTLSGSGSWGDLVVTMEDNGPLGDAAGWGVVLGFELHVINAQIIN